jgi:hypothetical protein
VTVLLAAVFHSLSQPSRSFVFNCYQFFILSSDFREEGPKTEGLCFPGSFPNPGQFLPSVVHKYFLSQCMDSLESPGFPKTSTVASSYSSHSLFTEAPFPGEESGQPYT